MILDADGLPRRSATAKGLGVRAGWDVFPDEDGNVFPGGGGMSVRPNPEAIPGHLLKGDCVVWEMNTDLLPDVLVHIPENDAHGLIEPAGTMRFEDFADAIAETREDWALAA